MFLRTNYEQVSILVNMRNYIDLTHIFTSKMPVYPGDVLPSLKQTVFIENGGHNNFFVSTGMHVGTHMDAPLHMIADGKKLSDYEPDKFFGNGHLIDARGVAISADLLNGHNIQQGDVVIVFTGFWEKFGQPDYYEKYPEIGEDFAEKMVDFGVKFVGMDTPSPDRAPYKIHKILLSKDILILENLNNLEELLEFKDFEIIALPAKFEADAAPVRVVAKVNY